MTAKPIAALLFWAAAVFLSVFISQNHGEASVLPPGEAGDPLSRFVGTAKEAIGDTLFVKADTYFHGGVTHEEHRDESAEAFEQEGLLAENGPAAGAAPADWIAAVNRRIQIHEISHLDKEKRKEMLPFFAMATALDPRNVEAVLTTAYWLEHEFGKTEDAAGVLMKGLRDNPGSWEIENALGRFYFRKKDWPAAEQHLSAAAERSAGLAMENYARVDLYYHLGESRLASGMKAEALEAYREAARFFDDKTAPYLRSVILEKINSLSGVQ